MKPVRVLSFLFCLGLASGLDLRAELVTLTAGGTSGVLASAPLDLAADEVAEVKSYYDTVYQPGLQLSVLTNQVRLFVQKGATTLALTSPDFQQEGNRDVVITGPAVVTLRYPVNRGTNYSAFATLDVTKPAATMVPTAAVVIPSDATGGVEVCLESSTDMINWSPAQPGTYGQSAERRFFRVRAIRQ